MLAWFQDHDLTATRQWFRQSAEMNKRAYEIRYGTVGAGGKTLELRAPLVSNDDELIAWFANARHLYNAKAVQDHKSGDDFWAYQAIVALRGEWRELEARCDRVLADPPRAASEQKYLVDHRFYRGLARGDEAEMLAALAEMLQPKAVRARGNDESGFTQDLIFTPALIYTKLAWRKGHRIDPRSPLVPSEWLPLDRPTTFPSFYDLGDAAG